MLKDLSIYVFEQVSGIPIPLPYELCACWPWIKNYYGEAEAAYFDYVPMQSTLWITQALKKEMGY